MTPVGSQNIYTQSYKLPEDASSAAQENQELSSSEDEGTQFPANEGQLKGGSHGDFSYAYDKFGKSSACCNKICCTIL